MKEGFKMNLKPKAQSENSWVEPALAFIFNKLIVWGFLGIVSGCYLLGFLNWLIGGLK